MLEFSKEIAVDVFEVNGRNLTLTATTGDGNALVIGQVVVPNGVKIKGNTTALIRYNGLSEACTFIRFTEGDGVPYFDIVAIKMEATALTGAHINDGVQFAIDAMINGGIELVKRVKQLRPANVDLGGALDFFLRDVECRGPDFTQRVAIELIEAGAPITDKTREYARASSYPELYQIVCGSDADMSKLESRVVRALDMMWQPKRYSSDDIIASINRFVEGGFAVTEFVLKEAAKIDDLMSRREVASYWPEVMSVLRKHASAHANL